MLFERGTEGRNLALSPPFCLFTVQPRRRLVLFAVVVLAADQKFGNRREDLLPTD